MKHSEAAKARVFGAGSDARFRGEPKTTNPYHGDEQKTEHAAWKAGWEDLNKNWGKGARWPVALLLGIVWEAKRETRQRKPRPGPLSPAGSQADTRIASACAAPAAHGGGTADGPAPA